MPSGAQILCVKTQGLGVFLWAKVNPENETEMRSFFIMGTGNPMRHHGTTYIGTVQDGDFMWHVFEKGVDHA